MKRHAIGDQNGQDNQLRPLPAVTHSPFINVADGATANTR
jgi:hypothetical protein